MKKTIVLFAIACCISTAQDQLSQSEIGNVRISNSNLPVLCSQYPIWHPHMDDGARIEDVKRGDHFTSPDLIVTWGGTIWKTQRSRAATQPGLDGLWLYLGECKNSSRSQ